MNILVRNLDFFFIVYKSVFTRVKYRFNFTDFHKVRDNVTNTSMNL